MFFGARVLFNLLEIMTKSKKHVCTRLRHSPINLIWCTTMNQDNGKV